MGSLWTVSGSVNSALDARRRSRLGRRLSSRQSDTYLIRNGLTMNLYLVAAPKLCMFVVVAESKWEAYQLYRNLQLPGADGKMINHFNSIERERMQIVEMDIIPLGQALQFVPKGVIADRDLFMDSLPETFVVP